MMSARIFRRCLQGIAIFSVLLKPTADAQGQFNTVPVVVTSTTINVDAFTVTTTIPVATVTSTQIVNFPATLTQTNALNTITVTETETASPVTTSLGVETVTSESVVTVTVNFETPPGPVTPGACGQAIRCQPGQTVCDFRNLAVCAPDQCEDGYYNDPPPSQGSLCRSCAARFGTICANCNSTFCLNCGVGSSFNPEVGECQSCEVFGKECDRCDANGCTSCINGFFLNLFLKCKKCKPTVGCPANGTFCTDGVTSSCLQGQCSNGYYNSQFLSNSTCVKCIPAVGCRESGTVCTSNSPQSVCVAGECLPYYYNQVARLPPAPPATDPSPSVVAQTPADQLPANSSQCRLLPIVLETYLPRMFLWDKDTQNFWLDSLMFCLSGNIASGVRQSYPSAYMQYLRIYQNEDRDGQIDVGLANPQGSTQLSSTILQLALLDDTCLKRLNISCVLIPQTPQNAVFGTYQRPICLGCQKIANCASKITCNGVPSLPTCTACKPGFFLVPGNFQRPDECRPCPSAPNCQPEFSRCTFNGSAPVCTLTQLNPVPPLQAGFQFSNCNQGYYYTAIQTTASYNIGQNEQLVNCVKCPISPGCKTEKASYCFAQNPAAATPDPITGFVALNFYCLKGECDEFDGWYNQDGLCFPQQNVRACTPVDISTCAPIQLRIETIWTEATWPGETWLPIFEDQINQVLGRSITTYPYPAWVTGTVTDPNTGHIIIDMRIINPQDTRQLLDLALAANTIPITPTSLVLYPLGIKCMWRPTFCYLQGYDPGIYQICLPCLPIPGCKPELYPGDGFEVTCPEGPYASRCPQCIDGFWNNRSIGYYPDSCELCPPARNCTAGNTVCTCQTDTMCKAGLCNPGFWNNPYLPVLECEAEDEYSCWCEDDMNAVARGLLPSRVSNTAPMYTLPLVQNLWSVAQYGIDKVRAFLHCPAYGKCRKANKRERKENVPERYWAYGSFIQSVPPSAFWIEYQNEEQKNFQDLDCWTGVCESSPQPKYASPCRRWKLCNEGEYEYISPTPISDRVCKPCTLCDFSCQYLAQNCTSLADSVCVTCTVCPLGTFQTRPCTTTADTACTSCAPIQSCILTSCTNATNSICSLCDEQFFINNQTQPPTCQSCSTCNAGFYNTSGCNGVNDTVCTQCPPAPGCLVDQTSCLGPTQTYCREDQCAPGFNYYPRLVENPDNPRGPLVEYFIGETAVGNCIDADLEFIQFEYTPFNTPLVPWTFT